jgi:hypothetical protein
VETRDIKTQMSSGNEPGRTENLGLRTLRKEAGIEKGARFPNMERRGKEANYISEQCRKCEDSRRKRWGSSNCAMTLSPSARGEAIHYVSRVFIHIYQPFDHDFRAS